jgi:hypothetical protein
MSELSDALRRYADDLDKGEPVKKASSLVVIVSNDQPGAVGELKATYMGRRIPVWAVGLSMCTLGIDRFLAMGMNTPSAPMFQAKGAKR